MSDEDLRRDPHFGTATGSGDWVVRCTLPRRYPGEDDIVGFLGGPYGVTRVRREARRFSNLADALRAGYDSNRISDDWTADELPPPPDSHRGTDGSGGRA